MIFLSPWTISLVFNSVWHYISTIIIILLLLYVHTWVLYSGIYETLLWCPVSPPNFTFFGLCFRFSLLYHFFSYFFVYRKILHLFFVIFPCFLIMSFVAPAGLIIRFWSHCSMSRFWSSPGHCFITVLTIFLLTRKFNIYFLWFKIFSW